MGFLDRLKAGLAKTAKVLMNHSLYSDSWLEL